MLTLDKEDLVAKFDEDVKFLDGLGGSEEEEGNGADVVEGGTPAAPEI